MIGAAKIMEIMGRGLGILAASAMAMASPSVGFARTIYEEYGVYPGQHILNHVDVVDRRTDHVVAEAEAELSVSSFDSVGVIRAFELPISGDTRTREIFRFLGANYSDDGTMTGNLHAMPRPVDSSALTGYLGQIDLSGPLELVETDVIRRGSPVFFVIEDASLNVRSDRQDRILVTVTDAITHDREVIEFFETGTDTGIFTAWVNTERDSAHAGNGVISTVGYSRIDATYVDVNNDTNSLRTEVMVGPIDPYGAVFDSATGDLIDGIKVTLIDVQTGAPAKVFSEDVVSSYPATVETGGQVRDSSGRVFQLDHGEYRFPYVYPGTYRYQVELPEGYDAPSLVSDAQLEALAGGVFEIGPGSRLDEFDIVPGPSPKIDIPLDHRTGGSIARDASEDMVEIGDIFSYGVTIEVPDMEHLDLRDTLPAGIRFIPGTMRIDGEPVTPVVSENGLVLDVSDLDVYPGQRIEVTYAAQVRMGASIAHPYISWSDASESGTGRMHMRASHALQVKDAFRLDDMPVVGQVVAGECGEKPEKRDLSNIRILLETGDYVLTDDQGRFSFRGIENRPHVLQMDPTTVPLHAHPVLCTNDTRSSGSAISQFVDVREGMMARAEFHLVFDRAAEAADISEAEEDFVPEDPMKAFGPDYEIADTTELRILTPVDGYLPSSETVDVAFLHPAGQEARLSVNGEEVDAVRAEASSTSKTGKTVLERYRALRIHEGRNLVSVELLDAEGQPVKEVSSEVFYATKVTKMELVGSASILESDGRTLPTVTMRLSDKKGYPVRPGTIVTVSVEDPFRFMPALRRNSEPGSARKPAPTVTTTVRENGLIRLQLAPAFETWRAKFTIHTDEGDVSTRVRISAAKRPWVLVGIAEGTAAERAIRDHMRKSGDIGGGMSGRIGLFAEGVVRGDWLLTLRVDSAKGRKDSAVTGIDPEQDYVVYGDRSVQDDASKSRFPIYLRLRKEGAEYLVGDFNTDISTHLVNFGRDVSGARALFEGDTYRVMAFAARTTQRYVEDRIALNGTLGPYQLTRGDILSGSETVRLLEVSRVDASREISSTDLVAGKDYTLSPTGGRLYLRDPIPAFSADGNRMVLVVGYETDEDVAAGLLAGVRAEVDVAENLHLGATAIHARKIDGSNVRVSLIGVDATLEINDALTVSAEAIDVRKTNGVSAIHGNEAELRAEYDDGISTASAFVNVKRGNTGLDASMEDRRGESAGAEVSLRLAEGDPIYDEKGQRDFDAEDKLGLFVEGTYAGERDRVNTTLGQEGEFLLVRKETDLEHGIGISFRERQSLTETLRATYLLNRAMTTSKDARLTWGVTFENSISESGIEGHDRLTLSADYALTEALTLSGEVEMMRPRADGASSGFLSAGLEYDMNDKGKLSFGAINAYGDAATGAALHFGLDQGVSLGKNTEITFGFTAQKDLGAFDIPLSLSSSNPYIAKSFTSASFGVRHTRETWSAGADLDLLDETDGRSADLRFSADGEIGSAWSVGGEASILRTAGRPTDNGTEVDLKFAAAHRRGSRDPISLYQVEMDRVRLERGSRSKIYVSAQQSRWIGKKDQVNLRAALKAVNFNDGVSFASDTLAMAGAEWRHDLTDKIDLGLHGSMMVSRDSGDRKTSAGISVGLTPFENGYLAIGYNIVGYREEDFSETGQTDAGAFIQFRVKLDRDTVKSMFR